MVKGSQYVDCEKSDVWKTTLGITFDATCSQEVKIKNEIANDIFKFQNFQFLRKIIQKQSSIPQSREIFTAVPEVIRWSYLANKSRYKICKNQNYSLIINEIH